MPETRYYRIAPKIWRHAATHQWDPETTTLAMYLLTCPHRNIAGLYVLPQPYIAADLRWDSKRIDRTLRRLIAEDFVRFDPQSQVVLVTNATAYDAPENGNQRKGALKYLAEVPESPLWIDLLTQAERYAPDFAKDIQQLIAKRFPELLSQRLPEPFDKPFPKRLHKAFRQPLAKPLAEPMREPMREPIGERNGNPVSVPVTVSVTVTDNDNRTRELASSWFQIMGGTINEVQLTGLDEYLDDAEVPLDLAVVIDAMKEAAKAGKRTWHYLEGILRRRRDQGLTTMDRVTAAEAERKQEHRSNGTESSSLKTLDQLQAEGGLPH